MSVKTCTCGLLMVKTATPITRGAGRGQMRDRLVEWRCCGCGHFERIGWQKVRRSAKTVERWARVNG